MKLSRQILTDRVPTRQLRRGTTLIELLVVIVVFLIGILAVIQIFPKGFQLLTVTRNNSIAVHLAEAEVEWLRQHADQLPDQIVSVRYLGNTTPVEDATRDPYDLSPQGDSVDATGMLSMGGSKIGNWLLYAGPNGFRRIIAETERVPSPRPVGINYGGLMVLNFGPVDSNAPIDAYSNDLTKSISIPESSGQMLSQEITVGSSAVNVPLYDSSVSLPTYEYFIASGNTANATLLLPTNASFPRTYHVKLGAYFTSAGNTYRLDYTDLAVKVPATTALDGNSVIPSLIEVPVSTLLADTPGAIPSGYTFAYSDYESVQVAPEFNLISNSATFSADPLEYKLLDANIGVLLFNPNAFSTFVERTGGPREPLLARVNYDVYDWRVIHQDVRLDNQMQLNGGKYGQFQLDLQSIKVGSSTGPDGLPNGVIAPLEGTAASYASTQSSFADNFVLIDLQTGGVVYEADPNDGHQIVSVNKSNGEVTINSDGSGSGLMGYLAIPGSSGPTAVDLTLRPLRVDYRARNEYSVNVLKAASVFTIVPTNKFSSEGQVYLNGANVLQFPRSDLHQQITIDEIDYTDSSGLKRVQNGQSFQIEVPTVNSTGLPQVDLSQSLPTGSTVTNVGVIKGDSIIAQVLWNPAQFQFGQNATNNIGLINTWEHNWRVNRDQTTVPAQELQ